MLGEWKVSTTLFALGSSDRVTITGALDAKEEWARKGTLPTSYLDQTPPPYLHPPPPWAKSFCTSAQPASPRCVGVRGKRWGGGGGWW